MAAPEDCVDRDPAGYPWSRVQLVWHGVFAALLLLVAVLALVEDGLAPERRSVTLILLAALAGWYALVGRPALARAGSSGGWYVAGLVPLVVAAFAAYPAAGLLLFAAYAQVWAVLRFRRAIVGTVALTAGLATASVLALGAGIPAAVLQGSVSLVLSMLLGTWIVRIVEQSERRAAVIGDLERTRAELAAVSHAAGVLAERERLAREIHDTLAQGFTSVLMLLELAESEVDRDPTAARRRLAVAQQTARQNLAEARSLVAALTPADLQAAPLPEAVGRLVDRFGRERGVPATLAVEGPARPLPASQEVVLLRAAQEALANVRRHAGSCRVSVAVRYREDGTELEVRDDGRGFIPDGEPVAGYGLAGMRRRVEEAGGVLRVDSAPADGTTVQVRLP